MKPSLPRYLLAVLLGVAIGWSLSLLRRPPEDAPAPRPPRTARLEPDPPAAIPEPEPARPQPVEPPRAATPGPVPASKPPPPPPPEWLARINSTLRVKDLLTLELPPGDDPLRRSCFYSRDQRARELLKSDAGQAAFLSDLPALNTKEMVALWDVFWLSDRDRSQGFRAYGNSFARKVSQSLAELVPAQTDPSLKTLAVTMLLPDTRFLNDREVEYLRSFLRASDDPTLKRKAEDLPDRGSR